MELKQYIKNDSNYNEMPTQTLINACYCRFGQHDNDVGELDSFYSGVDDLYNYLDEIDSFYSMVFGLVIMGRSICSGSVTSWVEDGYCGNNKQKVKDRYIEQLYFMVKQFGEAYNGEVEGVKNLFSRLCNVIEEIKGYIEVGGNSPCTVCSGLGTYWDVDEDDEDVQYECDYCGGNGVIDEGDRFRLSIDEDDLNYDYTKYINTDRLYPMLDKLTKEFIC